MNIIKLVEAIENRPGMYIDVDSFQSLTFFIQGYLFARTQLGVSDKNDILFTDQFYYWLKSKNTYLEDGESWGNLIEQISAKEGTSPYVVLFREFKSFFYEK